MKKTNCILFDDMAWQNLRPLTFTRPVAEIRVGILTIREKWEKYLNGKLSHLTEPHLAKKFPPAIQAANVLINGSVLPTKKLAGQILQLKDNEAIIHREVLIAARINEKQARDFSAAKTRTSCQILAPASPYIKINSLWDIFTRNGEALEADFQLLTRQRKSQSLDKTNQLLGKNIFIEKGAVINCSILNTTNGPIYIGKDAEVMEGSMIRGPFALCGHATLKLGAKIYGATTIGPHSKAGGEVNNSVITGYSNKAHDGFLGNSVIGEWCNIGADSNNSNLKNNYDIVKLWNYEKESFLNTGLQFCGLIMGDHSKCGINTMFNTGTTVGVSANVFGAGFPRNFIPDFSWGGASGFTTFQLPKAFEVAQKVMERRQLVLTETDKEILIHIFNLTAKYR